MKHTNYAFTKVVDLPFEQAIEKVTEELKNEGFGILTEIDLKSTLKKKLDVYFKPYKILGACNPPFAYQALQSEEQIGLMLPCNVIVYENEIGRFSQPAVIDGATIMIVAGIGVIINTVTAFLFFSGRKDDLNIKGAFLHMAADAGISLGVVIVGLVLAFTNLYWLDPVVSIVIALIIFWGTWDLLKDSVNLALDAVCRILINMLSKNICCRFQKSKIFMICTSGR